jgi:hypothetical protein
MSSGKNGIVICSTNDRFAFEDGTISETLEVHFDKQTGKQVWRRRLNRATFTKNIQNFLDESNTILIETGDSLTNDMQCVCAGRQGTELALISRQEWQELVDCNEMQEDGTVIEVDEEGEKSSLGRKITAIDELPDEWFVALCDYLGLLIDRFGEKVRNQYYEH